MERRRFIGTVAGGVVAATFGSQAFSAQDKVIGVILNLPLDDKEGLARFADLRNQLRELGWTEGKNIRMEVRWTAGDKELLSKYAKELVALQPDVLIVHTTAGTAAVLRETQTLPIVFVHVSDPVGVGFTNSFSRPSRNASGFTNIEFSLGSKWLGLLKDIAPSTSRVSIMFNPALTPHAPKIAETAIAVSKILGITTVASAPVQSVAEAEKVCADLGQTPGGGLMILPDTLLTGIREQLVSFAAHYQLPAIYPFSYFAQLGGLISYGTVSAELYRNAASYASRILLGADIHDLPIVSPTKYELIVNRKTAKALGLEVPPTLLALSDKVLD